MTDVKSIIGVKNCLRIVTNGNARTKDIGELLTLIDELYSIRVFTDSLFCKKYRYYDDLYHIIKDDDLNKEDNEKDNNQGQHPKLTPREFENFKLFLRSANPSSVLDKAIEKGSYTYYFIGEDYLPQNDTFREFLIEALNFPLQPNFNIDFIDKITRAFKELYRLEIVSISKNSPLLVTLIGVPEIIEKIKDLIVSMVCLKQELRGKKLDNDIKYEELRAKKLDNMYKFLELSNKPEIAQFILTENEKTRLLESKIDETMKVIESIEKIETIDLNEAS